MILGLDISTSCTGWAILDDNGVLVELGHIDFKGADTFWEKVDIAMVELNNVWAKYQPQTFYVEESLQGFRPGFSSASTLLTLAKFNGLLSFFMRQLVGKDPIYISSAVARKTCGIKLQQKKKCGKGHKEQVGDYLLAHDLKHVTWPTKKNGNIADWAFDAMDAYVIARAGSIMSISTSRKKKSHDLSTSGKGTSDVSMQGSGT